MAAEDFSALREGAAAGELLDAAGGLDTDVVGGADATGGLDTDVVGGADATGGLDTDVVGGADATGGLDTDVVGGADATGGLDAALEGAAGGTSSAGTTIPAFAAGVALGASDGIRSVDGASDVGAAWGSVAKGSSFSGTGDAIGLVFGGAEFARGSSNSAVAGALATM
ncbi:MAG: hypothetical protein R3B13_05110 [Polyangiaceae bacterium]